jgi:hypothetical protein
MKANESQAACQPCHATAVHLYLLHVCSNAAVPIITVGWSTPELIGSKNHALVLGEDGRQSIKRSLVFV